jgi:hypothetical protein
MKNYFKTALFILFLGISSSTFAQKCEVSKDPITGEKLITVNYRERWVYMENKGDQTKLSVVKGYVGEVNVSAPVGSEFIIKLDNDEIIKLTTTAIAAPNSYASQGVVYTNFTYEVIIDKNILTKLSAHVPVLIRVPDIKTGDRDMVEKKYFKAINTGAKYILEH